MKLGRGAQASCTLKSKDEVLSSVVENTLDHVDADPIDTGHLDSRHTVLYPATNARKMRLRNLGRHPLLGVDRQFVLFVADRRRRQGFQNARFPGRLVGRRNGFLNWWFGSRPPRAEYRFCLLACFGNPRAIIAVRVDLLLPASKHD